MATTIIIINIIIIVCHIITTAATPACTVGNLQQIHDRRVKTKMPYALIMSSLIYCKLCRLCYLHIHCGLFFVIFSLSIIFFFFSPFFFIFIFSITTISISNTF